MGKKNARNGEALGGKNGKGGRKLVLKQKDRQLRRIKGKRNQTRIEE